VRSERVGIDRGRESRRQRRSPAANRIGSTNSRSFGFKNAWTDSPDEADSPNDFHRTQPRINATAAAGDDAGGTWTA
jgi:hypothetical protein